jgi:cardiolipin synthetase 2 (EC 2.7.8.-)
MADSNAAIARIVADIDAAQHSVHLLFYIWLDDHNGRRVADALRRAAARGVSCRALVDDLGSHAFIRSTQWPALAAAGVQVLRRCPWAIRCCARCGAASTCAITARSWSSTTA